MKRQSKLKPQPQKRVETPLPKPCNHHYCRCMRAAELAAMGLILEAIQVHYGPVACRQESRSVKEANK